MGFLDNLNFEFDPRCKTEKGFEKSLAHFLEEDLKGSDVVWQYGSGRVKGDIVVGKRVLIEVKVNIDSTGKLQRL